MSAPTAAVLAMKLVWNSPPDAEMVYDNVFAELMTRLIYESVDYVSKVADSDDGLEKSYGYSDGIISSGLQCSSFLDCMVC